jgi:hypothetical protein
MVDVQGKFGVVKEIPFDDLLKLADPDLHDVLKNMVATEGTDGIMVYEVLDMSSSAFGARHFMVFGPTRTYKTAEAAADGHLNDLPSQRAYPTAYARAPR